jgi:hypothetical protein
MTRSRHQDAEQPPAAKNENYLKKRKNQKSKIEKYTCGEPHGEPRVCPLP